MRHICAFGGHRRSPMEEFLLHHCVTSDVAMSAADGKTLASPAIWQSSGRAECVLVQENHQAHGASRVILSAMLKLTLQSAKTSNVLLLTLDSPLVAQSVEASTKFTHVDYSADAANVQSSVSASQIIAKILHDIESVEANVDLKGATSARPMVVVLDSLNALLQQTSLQQVLCFLRQLRSHTVVGSVIARLNSGAESPEVAQALAAQATALILVETRLSLRSYPLLSKERKREIPPKMHGLALLVRQKKNGRSSEILEYFQVLGDTMRFIGAVDIDCHTGTDQAPKSNVSTSAPSTNSEFKLKSKPDIKPSLITRPAATETSSQAPLPVRQEDVSFNLSISAAERRVKRKVQLPYMHQGKLSASEISDADPVPGNNLFFIDEDDPDWDDDDLDDDLDI